MFGEGKIKSYNQDRGFGFIQIENNKKEIFFHISDIPESSEPLRIGETLKFRIVEEYGKLKADYIVRVALEGADLHPMQIMHEEYDEHKIEPPKVTSSALSKIIGILAFIIIGLISYELYTKYSDYKQRNEHKLAVAAETQMNAIKAQIQAVKDLPDKVKLPERVEKRVQPMYSQAQQTNYTCDGRIHCSQMRSYEEALFFLRNCPGVKMDGNLDGIPCERQFGR